MKLELRRIDPLRSANVLAVLYGLTTAAFALLFSPFILIMGLLAPSDEFGLAGGLFAMLALFIYPIMGFVMGWISGFLSAVIYNFIIRWTGGLLLEYDDVAPASQSLSPPNPSAV